MRQTGLSGFRQFYNNLSKAATSKWQRGLPYYFLFWVDAPPQSTSVVKLGAFSKHNQPLCRVWRIFETK